MKKIIFTLIMAGLMITGCGKEETVKETANSIVEETVVEDVLVEDIIYEDKIYVDDEYAKELGYNSQTNSWGN